MKIVNILPTYYIDKPWCWISDIHLPLAHMIEDGNKYTEQFKHLKDCNEKITNLEIPRVAIMLDNGFFELGKSPSIEKLIDKAKLINADYLTLPDIMFENKIDMEDKISDMISVVPKNIKVITVVAAYNLKGAINCFGTLNGIDEVNMIAIPDRLLSDNTWIRRARFLDVIEEMFYIQKDIHLFALDDYRELPDLNRPYVKSIDTTMHFKLGYYNMKLPLMAETQDPRRPENYFEINELNVRQIDAIRHNKDYLRRLIDNGYG